MKYKEIDKNIDTAGRIATTMITQKAQANAPRKFGTLKRSIHAEVDTIGGKFTGNIIQDSGVAKYGKWVENGTGLYGEHKRRITPVNKKALSWKSGGKRITVKSTKGMKGRFYMKRAFEEGKDEVKRILTIALMR